LNELSNKRKLTKNAFPRHHMITVAESRYWSGLITREMNHLFVEKKERSSKPACHQHQQAVRWWVTAERYTEEQCVGSYCGRDSKWSTSDFAETNPK